MKLWQDVLLEPSVACPYLPGRLKQYEYFLATDLRAEELSRLLAEGWRKFGSYFFRPRCPACRQCIPLRVQVDEFSPSRSQRRILRRNAELDVRFGPLHLSAQAYNLYRLHSMQRFGQRAEIDDFVSAFYRPSCPTQQVDILEDGVQVGVGFLDQGSDALSSVYFCFDPDRHRLNLGTFSVLREMEHARELGLCWYYLGYYVPGCSRMDYKDRFLPRQHYDWDRRCWFDPLDSPL